MKRTIALFAIAAMFAPSAFAAEITPYVGLGVVADKAGTTAKRVKFDQSKISADISGAFVPNAGGNMDFDMAFAGEITAGIKYGNVRAELEAAFRSASEDDYELYNGKFMNFLPTEIETSTSVRHNSYMANLYYDFSISGSKWTPYVGAGIGFGTYRQKATVDIDVDEDVLAFIAQNNPEMLPLLKGIPLGEQTVANDKLTEFEWQVGLGAAYNFNEDWAFDIGYRFNSSNVAGEFVYAHEVKLGARYSF